MSFPYDDKQWCDAASFVEARLKAEDRVVGPDIFWWRFSKLYRYTNTRDRPADGYDWVILHKGMLDEVSARFAVRALEELKPVFANEVFVILAAAGEDDALPEADHHLRAVTDRLPDLRMAATAEAKGSGTPATTAEPGVILKFSSLTTGELASTMDDFFRRGGYVYETLRDKTYYAEIDRHISLFAGDCAGKRVLDLACGVGRLANLMSFEARVTGIDISGVAIEMARERHAHLANFTFRTMDAHALEFPDGAFDVVLFIDAIEHVADAETVFAEMQRVLTPGGLMLATVANRDSVNQVLTRKLGHPEFVTNYQHIREFAYAETLDLMARHGFRLERSAGIFLYPYWGVPGIDGVVRKLTDEDPGFVELMRTLGEKVGAEHAYCSVVSGRKA